MAAIIQNPSLSTVPVQPEEMLELVLAIKKQGLCADSELRLGPNNRVSNETPGKMISRAVRRIRRWSLLNNIIECVVLAATSTPSPHPAPVIQSPALRGRASYSTYAVHKSRHKEMSFILNISNDGLRSKVKVYDDDVEVNKKLDDVESAPVLNEETWCQAIMIL